MFGLDPQSIVDRVKASAKPMRMPTMGESVVRGMMGFTLVSLGGFAPWMFTGERLYRVIGEGGLYFVCALVFIVLSGPLLNRLIIGPNSFVRFYKVFTLAFLAYTVAWTTGWMLLRGDLGSVVGLFAGTAVMGLVFAGAFSARSVAWNLITVLFLGNTAGYFLGGWMHNTILALKGFEMFGVVLDRTAQAELSKAIWGLFYGQGFGAGIGYAFHRCQEEARKRIVALPGSGNQSRADYPSAQIDSFD